MIRVSITLELPDDEVLKQTMVIAQGLLQYVEEFTVARDGD